MSVSLILILVLMVVFVPRGVEQADAMEQRRFDLRLAELNAAMRLKSMKLLTSGSTSEIAAGMNPFDWIDYYDPSENIEATRYLGVIDHTQDEGVPRMWVFDAKLGAVGYLPGSEIEFQGQPYPSGKWMWFKIQDMGTGSVIWQLALMPESP